MSKQATIARDNIYYQARMKAAIHEECFKGRPGAAEVLHINETTLAKYELEKLPVRSDMALAMAEAYNTPELLNQYCCDICPIGAQIYKHIDTRNLESVALRAAKNFINANEIKDKFIEIAADGVIDESEQGVLEEIIEYFDRIKTIANELDLWAKQNIDIKKSTSLGRTI